MTLTRRGFVAALAASAWLGRASARSLVPALALSGADALCVVRSGGRLWLAGEIGVTHRGTDAYALRRLFAASADGKETSGFALSGTALAEAVAGEDRKPLPNLMLAGLASATIWLWHALPKGQVPEAVALEFAAGSVLVKTQALPIVDVADPVTLHPPLRGGPWVAVYDPLFPFGHRRSAFADGDTRFIPARFAIDFIRLDDDGRPAPRNLADFASWQGFGTEVLAVADGEIAAVRTDRPDVLTDTSGPRGGHDDVAGNFIALALARQRFAFYEHLQAGSVQVRVGQHVKRGEVIGKLGRSGINSSGPHLHFHVANGPSTLHAQGRPWALSRFEHLGSYDSMAAAEAGKPWLPRPQGHPATVSDELPPPNSVVRFG